MYPSEAIAEEALLAAWTTYTYKQGDGPIAVYRCEDCGEYHLTSRGPINPRLAKSLENGEITRLKDSETWMSKFNKKGRH
jgi:hypothetical protein